MKNRCILLLTGIMLLVACKDEQYQNTKSWFLAGEIEKTWHKDSILTNSLTGVIKPTAICVSDDKYIFRYDKTLTYFNNQTEWMFSPSGMACGDSTIYAIKTWEILNDSILYIQNDPYTISFLNESKMILKTIKGYLKESGTDSIPYFTFEFFYARE